MFGANDSEERPARESSAQQNAGENWTPTFLPPGDWDLPLSKSLLGNLADTFAPEKLPPLRLTSRPAESGYSRRRPAAYPLVPDNLHQPGRRDFAGSITAPGA